MASVPALPSEPAPRRRAGLKGWLQPGFAAAAVVLAVSAVELAIADRKYGVFTGGFGQPEAVDSVAERIVFVAAYGVAQAALALLVWCLCLRVNRAAGRYTAALHFAFLFGGAMLAALIARYQLHRYFSDAVDFALLKNLGGGSLKDALLFGKNELALGLAALGAFGMAWWLAGRAARRWLRLGEDEPAPRPPWHLAAAACGLWLLALAAVPRMTDDEARGLERMLGWSMAGQLAASLTDFDGDGYGLFGL